MVKGLTCGGSQSTSAVVNVWNLRTKASFSLLWSCNCLLLRKKCSHTDPQMHIRACAQTDTRNLQVPSVKFHDLLLHLFLVRQQLVGPQVVAVSCVVIVTDLSWRTQGFCCQHKLIHAVKATAESSRISRGHCSTYTAQGVRPAGMPCSLCRWGDLPSDPSSSVMRTSTWKEAKQI